MVIFLFRILTSYSVFGSGFSDSPTVDEKSFQVSWMTSVPDATLLSAISIPGTHESLTRYGGPLIQCQTLSMEKQLKAGLRYFDIHVGSWIKIQQTVDVRDGHIKHQKFRDALETTRAFLDENSSETVLFRVTIEGFFQKTTGKLVKKLLEEFKDKLWTKTIVPQIGEVRGKIVFIQSNNFNVGTLNHNTYFKGDNKFKNIPNKMKKIKKHLEEAGEICSHTLVLTESTATAFFKGPKSVAKEVNNQLNTLIMERKKGSEKPACVGVVSMDFPSSELIRNIIEIGRASCRERV